MYMLSTPAEPPATCFDANNPDPDAFQKCASGAVLYNELEGDEGKANWSAEPNVVLDASFLFRGIVLNRPVDISGVTIAQVRSSCLSKHVVSWTFPCPRVIRSIATMARGCLPCAPWHAHRTVLSTMRPIQFH
jgi:hypothetical protein